MHLSRTCAVMLSVPKDLRDSVRCVDDNMVAIDDKISKLSKEKQIELWQYFAHKARNKYKALKSELQPEEVSEAQNQPPESKTVEMPRRSVELAVCSKANDPAVDLEKSAKKRKLEYSPEWWRSYEPLTVEQMRQILKDNLAALPREHQRGLGLDRKDVLKDKIAGLRVALKRRATLTFDEKKPPTTR